MFSYTRAERYFRKPIEKKWNKHPLTRNLVSRDQYPLAKVDAETAIDSPVPPSIKKKSSTVTRSVSSLAQVTFIHFFHL